MRIRTTFFSLMILLGALLTTGCLLPETFTADATLNKDRSYAFTFKGTMLYYPYSMDIRKPGEVFPYQMEEFEKSMAEIAEKLLEEEGDMFREARYVGNGLLDIEYAAAGKLTETYSFPNRKSPLLTFVPENKDGVIVVAGDWKRDDYNELKKNGVKINGTFSLKTDAEILMHNAQKTPGPRSKAYVWTIGPGNPPPRMVLKISNNAATAKTAPKRTLNFAEAEEAAKLGDVEAQTELGFMYRNGRGVQKDNEKAVYWHQKAADQGNTKAQCNLGFMYRNGFGVRKEDEKAAYWYQKAAEQGNVEAQLTIGIMYRNGRGVQKDNEKALYWYQKAADQGNDDALLFLGGMYIRGEGVQKDVSRATDLYHKSAELGNIDAQRLLGDMYADGRVLKKDDEKAAHWYRKAADQGQFMAQINLGIMYTEGRGVKKDEHNAARWFKQAAKRDHVDAQVLLADMYVDGRGVKKDDEKAAHWYRKAADQGNVKAQFALGVMYTEGRGVSRDETLGCTYLNLAADKGKKEAIERYNKICDK